MGRFLFRLVFWGLILGLGWIFGAKWGAPAPVIDAFDRVVSLGAEQAQRTGDKVAEELGDVDAREVTGELADDLKAEAGEAATSARRTAEELIAAFDAEHEPVEVGSEDPAATPVKEPNNVVGAKPASAALATARTSSAMSVCLTSISNSPPTDENGAIRNFTPLINVDGVKVLLAPATKACLSSGYGPRGSRGRLHKGVDYYTKEDGMVLAAADGVIVEAVYRDDYGYMIIIDHGKGVYTRSAHLKRFEPGVAAGVTVKRGAVLGPIGQSGAYTSIQHLHFEILRGDYDTQKKSFGLTPADPYGFPAA